MRKLTSMILVLATLLTLLFSFLPMTVAHAQKDPNDLTLRIHNRTGGQVILNLVDTDGNVQFFSFIPGQSNVTIPAGNFRYYASTPCGNRAGTFNLNVTKELFFSCGEGIEVTLQKSPNHFCHPVYDYWEFTGNQWANMGNHCQDFAPNEEQYIQYNVPDPAGTYYGDAWFFNSGTSACAPEFGPGYYYYDCKVFAN